MKVGPSAPVDPAASCGDARSGVENPALEAPNGLRESLARSAHGAPRGLGRPAIQNEVPAGPPAQLDAPRGHALGFLTPSRRARGRAAPASGHEGRGLSPNRWTAACPRPTSWVCVHCGIVAGSGARAKLCKPWTDWTCFVTEFDGEDRCFGLVSGPEVELGYFNLSEVEARNGPGSLRVQRDLHFAPRPAKSGPPRPRREAGRLQWARKLLRLPLSVGRSTWSSASLDGSRRTTSTTSSNPMSGKLPATRGLPWPSPSQSMKRISPKSDST